MSDRHDSKWVRTRTERPTTFMFYIFTNSKIIMGLRPVHAPCGPAGTDMEGLSLITASESIKGSYSRGLRVPISTLWTPSWSQQIWEGCWASFAKVSSRLRRDSRPGSTPCSGERSVKGFICSFTHELSVLFVFLLYEHEIWVVYLVLRVEWWLYGWIDVLTELFVVIFILNCLILVFSSVCLLVAWLPVGEGQT